MDLPSSASAAATRGFSVRVRSALCRLVHPPRIRGTPFPFAAEESLSVRTLNCCVAYNRYGGYYVPISGLHRPAALRVLTGDVWEVPTLEFIARHYTGGDIVHAGTFFGDFLPPLSRMAAEGRTVWAFEPHPESCRCAGIAVPINQLHNVRIINAGLGEITGSQQLATTDFQGTPLGGASQMLPNREDAWEPRGDQSALVEIVAIDEVVPADRVVSIIQLDIEGYEQQALSGAMRTIERDRPILIVETLPAEEWVAQYLMPLGYRMTERILENAVLKCS
jgi:FkbM family methyltransferase